MARFESVLDAIGGTPLIRVTPRLRPRVYVKPEWQNPGGSVKDRAALSMLRAAEADGSLRPGGTVVELTSGNTGIGLALAAAHLGYRAVIFTSSTIASEKRAQLTAYGAELRLVDTFVPKDHPDSLRSHAERFVAGTPGAWFAKQYDNPANPAAHYATTGPEIWADSDGAVTHFVSTVGTGGSISGTGRYLKEVSSGAVRVIGADPITSSYSGGDGSQKYIEGAGHFVHPEATHDEWPQSLDLSVIDEYIGVSDEEAITVVRELARTEGILAGGSSGVALAAGFRVAERLSADDTVVILLPDSGRQYLSTYFNDTWLAANGFTPGPVEAREAVFVERGEDPPAGLDDDDPFLVLYPREKRTLAPHPTDVIGWTTRARLRRGDIEKVTARVGAGQPAPDDLTGPALVLTHGRVTGLLPPN